MSAKTAKARGDRAARAVPALRPRRASRCRALGRHGAAADGRAGDHAPARDPVPRRADRRPRPAEPHRAVGDPRRAARRRPDDPPHHALHGGGRRALRPARDHRPRPAARARHAGGAQALGRRRHHGHGAAPTGDLDALADRAREPTSPGAQQVERVDGTVRLGCSRHARACCPRVFDAAERHGFDVTDLSVTEPTLETVFINLTGKDLRE